MPTSQGTTLVSVWKVATIGDPQVEVRPHHKGFHIKSSKIAEREHCYLGHRRWPH